MDESREPQRKAPAQAAKYLGVGLTWVGSTALFLYLGSLLDGAWSTEPVFTLIGAFVGAVAGFYHLYRQVIAGSGPGPRQKTDRKQ